VIFSRLAAFAKLAPKLTRAAQELGKVKALAAKPAPNDDIDVWERTSALALAVHNVYNGIEDVLLNVANDVDGAVPTGETSHQDLLDQMLSPIPERRPALLSTELYQDLVELKNFRHLVRHRYGFDLDPVKVRDNVARLSGAFPTFVEALRALEQSLAAIPRPPSELRQDGSTELL
jgi:hypothetical protein